MNVPFRNTYLNCLFHTYLTLPSLLLGQLKGYRAAPWTLFHPPLTQFHRQMMVGTILCSPLSVSASFFSVSRMFLFANTIITTRD
ncbi:rCG52330 [Rattus norvegicus]|uniref:RCG52330 n=1 Tax=Rattus norvegicus TaxID=10116 RepID=A6K0M6_RAT|nr:rCG52330 [Rattus norvegicus]